VRARFVKIEFLNYVIIIFFS